MKNLYTTLLYIYLSSVSSICGAETILWDGNHGSFFKTEDYSLGGNYGELTEFMKNHDFTLTESRLPFDKDTLDKAKVLVLTINAKKDYSKIEVESIINFVRNGGGVLALCDAKNLDHNIINGVLESFGIICGEGDEIQQNGLTKVTISSDPIFNEISEISFKWVGQVKVRDKAGARIVGSSIGGKPIDIMGVAEVEKGRIVVIGDMDVFANSLLSVSTLKNRYASASAILRSFCKSAFCLSIAKSKGAIRSSCCQGRPRWNSYLNFPSRGNKASKITNVIRNSRILLTW